MWASHQKKMEKAEERLRLSLLFPSLQAFIAIYVLIYQLLDPTLSVALFLTSLMALLTLYFSLKQFEEASYDVIVKIFPITLTLAAIGGLGISVFFVYSSYSIIKEVFYKRGMESKR